MSLSVPLKKKIVGWKEVTRQLLENSSGESFAPSPSSSSSASYLTSIGPPTSGDSLPGSLSASSVSASGSPTDSSLSSGSSSEPSSPLSPSHSRSITCTAYFGIYHKFRRTRPMSLLVPIEKKKFVGVKRSDTTFALPKKKLTLLFKHT